MRAFVIGNGPSLKPKHLDLIRGEASFAAQRIHLIYPKTRWRPTDYVLADRYRPSLYPIWKQDVYPHFLSSEECWVREDFKVELGSPEGLNIHYFPPCYHALGQRDSILSEERPRAWHLPEICKYGGSVVVAIQLAVREGFNPIYLMGCDLGYKDAANINHFDPNYCPPDSYPMQVARRENATLKDAHEIAFRECAATGIEIVNVGVGGELNAYPRKSLESVL